MQICTIIKLERPGLWVWPTIYDQSKPLAPTTARETTLPQIIYNNSSFLGSLIDHSNLTPVPLYLVKTCNMMISRVFLPKGFKNPKRSKIRK